MRVRLVVRLFSSSQRYALAGPILYRTLFAHNKRACAHIAKAAFVRFECHLILIGMAALGLAMAADMLAVPSFYRSGGLLTTFYAAYCVFPLHKRLMLDRRLYRVATKHRKPPAPVVHPNPAVRQARLPGERQRWSSD